MAFIEYTAGKGGLRPGSAKLTKTHLIISPDLQEKIDQPNILIAYDPELEIFRLKPVASGGLKLNDGKLQSKGFCKFFAIHDKRGIFKAEWNDKEKAIFITLKENKD